MKNRDEIIKLVNNDINRIEGNLIDIEHLFDEDCCEEVSYLRYKEKQLKKLKKIIKILETN